MAWGFDEQPSDSVDYCIPFNIDTSIKKLKRERLPYIRKRGLAPLLDCGEEWYFRFNQDTIFLIRLAMSFDGYEDMGEEERRLLEEFIIFEDKYSQLVPFGFDAITMLNEDRYSYAIKNGVIDTRYLAIEPTIDNSIDSVSSKALDDMLVNLVIEDEMFIKKELMYSRQVKEIGCVKRGTIVQTTSIPDGLGGGSRMETPFRLKQRLESSSEEVVYHQKVRSYCPPYINCPYNFKVMIDECKYKQVFSQYEKDIDFTISSPTNNTDIGLSFDKDSSTIWIAESNSILEDRYIEIEFNRKRLLQYMTLSSSSTSASTQTKNFRIEAWNDIFKVWYSVGLYLDLDARVNDTLYEYVLLKTFTKKMRIRILDDTRMIASNISIFPEAPELHRAFGKEGQYNCWVLDEPMSIFEMNEGLLYHGELEDVTLKLISKLEHQIGETYKVKIEVDRDVVFRDKDWEIDIIIDQTTLIRDVDIIYPDTVLLSKDSNFVEFDITIVKNESSIDKTFNTSIGLDVTDVKDVIYINNNNTSTIITDINKYKLSNGDFYRSQNGEYYIITAGG